MRFLLMALDSATKRKKCRIAAAIRQTDIQKTKIKMNALFQDMALHSIRERKGMSNAQRRVQIIFLQSNNGVQRVKVAQKVTNLD